MTGGQFLAMWTVRLRIELAGADAGYDSVTASDHNQPWKVGAESYAVVRCSQ